MKPNTEITTHRRIFYPPGRDDANGSVQQVARYCHQLDQAQFREDTVEVAALEAAIPEDEERIREEEERKRTGREEAKTKFRLSRWELVCANLLMGTSFALMFYALLPSFWGGLLWLALLICAGACMVGFWATHFFLHYSEKVMPERHHQILIAVVMFFMLLLAMWGATWLSRSRALQSEALKQMESVSVSDPKLSTEPKPAKEKIEYYNNMGTMLFFLGAEWIGGVLLYRALRKRKLYGTIFRLLEKIQADRHRLLFLQKRMARTGNRPPHEYLADVIFVKRKRSLITSLPFLIIVILLFLAAIIFFLFPSGRVFGADLQCSYSIIAKDVTGSRPEQEMLEDDKGIVGFIIGRKPGDKGLSTIVTEGSFAKREPEYDVHFQMPAKNKVGYFNEEMTKVKRGVIREFLEKSQKIPKKRPGTSLIDAIFMYARILKEQDENLKNLIFFSDMRQCAQGINEESIVKKGDQVVARLKADGLIPNMKGINVWCMGVSSNGLNVFQYQKIENFWRTFFAAAQANLRCYDFGRSRSID
jgi:flagellar basal body-associated protein FliL